MKRSALRDHADLLAFTDLFEASFMARKAPAEMALFSLGKTPVFEHVAVTDETLTLAPEIAAARDWVDVDETDDGSTWGLLVGHAGAPERFGITLGGR